jgi:hypothetical protein
VPFLPIKNLQALYNTFSVILQAGKNGWNYTFFFAAATAKTLWDGLDGMNCAKYKTDENCGFCRIFLF